MPSTFPCSSCGAELSYEPGTRALRCPHCRAETEIPQADDEQAAAALAEVDFLKTIAEMEGKSETVDALVVHCDSCGADVTMQPNVTSAACAFCGSRVVATARSQKLIKPAALVPFQIPPQQARQLFAKWIKGLWWAPGNLKRFAEVDGTGAWLKGDGGSSLAGLYMPCWTFDSKADTPYTGERGDDYWDTETYWTTVNGKSQMQTRRVRKTRWTRVRGRVRTTHDDVLVPASTSLPQVHINRIGNFNLKALVPYADGFLSGFRAESYALDLRGGFTAARGMMENAIRAAICRDIGGDHQRIHTMHPAFSAVTFKHILLPVWVSAYRYNRKVYRFVINGQTGAVSGERPYSAWKITIASLLGVAAIIILVAVLSSMR